MDHNLLIEHHAELYWRRLETRDWDINSCLQCLLKEKIKREGDYFSHWLLNNLTYFNVSACCLAFSSRHRCVQSQTHRAATRKGKCRTFYLLLCAFPISLCWSQSIHTLCSHYITVWLCGITCAVNMNMMMCVCPSGSHCQPSDVAEEKQWGKRVGFLFQPCWPLPSTHCSVRGCNHKDSFTFRELVYVMKAIHKETNLPLHNTYGTANSSKLID